MSATGPASHSTDGSSPHDAPLGRAVLDDLAERFRSLRELADRALAQVDDEAYFATLDAEGNSVALLAKHVGGNLRSRFSDFLVSDGEKPDRDRDAEFEVRPGDTRATIEESWAAGWATLEATLASLAPADLSRTVRLRGEPLSALQALTRALAHVGQHVGQIVLLARHWAGPEWETLSIPRARK